MPLWEMLKELIEVSPSLFALAVEVDKACRAKRLKDEGVDGTESA
ncbi:hypothetical protein [Streptomyces apocyni]|nr:hypothetical protein [Streptomyces apocyni]